MLLTILNIGSAIGIVTGIATGNLLLVIGCLLIALIIWHIQLSKKEQNMKNFKRFVVTKHLLQDYLLYINSFETHEQAKKELYNLYANEPDKRVNYRVIDLESPTPFKKEAHTNEFKYRLLNVSDISYSPLQKKDTEHKQVKDSSSTSDITKRELFSVLAMQGIISSNDKYSLSRIAQISVQCADALIEELKKNKK